MAPFCNLFIRRSLCV